MDIPNGRIELIARGLWQDESRVLLCQNVRHGYFYLPGGHVEPGESAAEACQREFIEETGMEVTVGACLLVSKVRFLQKNKPRHELNLVFLVEPAQTAERDSSDQAPLIQSREPKISFEWVDVAAITDLDLRPGVLRAWLASGRELSSYQPCSWISVNEANHTGT